MAAPHPAPVEHPARRLPRQDLPAPRRDLAGFDFTWHIRRVCADMVQRLPELAHIKLAHVAISFCQARRRVAHGLHASLMPMRFEGGRLVDRRRGRDYRAARLWDTADREMLYILSFYLPRFLDSPFQEKLVTILHELWHISPQFDGDLRRHAGRCYVHTHSEKQYDRAMARLAARWLQENPPREVYAFLESNYGQLRHQYGAVFGTRISTPKLVPCEEPS